MTRTIALVACLAMGFIQSAARAEELPLLYADDFEKGMDRWQTTDPDPSKNSFWKVEEVPGFDGKPTHVMRVLGMSDYQPKYRSPPSIAWLKDVSVGDFVMTAKVQSTKREINQHLDMCLFWGRQDATHFYYVHLGAQADPHSCQIFIVNDAPRTAITVKTAKGTPWDPMNSKWHDVKVVHRLADGAMEVYFDDMKTPFMTAADKTFGAGAVGLGTFDDNGQWDDFELRGEKVDAEKPSAATR